jgi:hypothetical protein
MLPALLLRPPPGGHHFCRLLCMREGLPEPHLGVAPSPLSWTGRRHRPGRPGRPTRRARPCFAVATGCLHSATTRFGTGAATPGRGAAEATRPRSTTRPAPWPVWRCEGHRVVRCTGPSRMALGGSRRGVRTGAALRSTTRRPRGRSRQVKIRRSSSARPVTGYIVVLAEHISRCSNGTVKGERDGNVELVRGERSAGAVNEPGGGRMPTLQRRPAWSG